MVVRPEMAMLVPEGREEITTEGGQTALIEALALYRELRAEAPPDITDEWQQVIRSIERLDAALDDAGQLRRAAGDRRRRDHRRSGLEGDPAAESGADRARSAPSISNTWSSVPETSPTRRWVPGADVVHAELGPGWVWGSGRGVVTVRFETAETPAGPVRSFPVDAPELHAWEPP